MYRSEGLYQKYFQPKVFDKAPCDTRMRSMYRVKQSSNTNLNTIDGRRIGKEGNYTYLHLCINVTMKSFHRLDFVHLVLFIIFKKSHFASFIIVLFNKIRMVSI